MHELSIAQNLVEVAAERLAASGWDRATERASAVKVRIGAMSGVVPEALQSAFTVAIVGTELEGATLRIESVDLAVWCPNCLAEQTLAEQQLICPACGQPTPRIIRGKELELVSIEVTDATPDRGSTAAHT